MNPSRTTVSYGMLYLYIALTRLTPMYITFSILSLSNTVLPLHMGVEVGLRSTRGIC